ncbi:hypothetical protein, partial [Porphyromonas gulae]|uniref:hypothetical protein n=1 Tax=Porphyromonas gulae TaxID=111105 RepID=UPI001F407242
QRQTILTEEVVQSRSEYRLSQKATKHLMRLPWIRIHPSCKDYSSLLPTPTDKLSAGSDSNHFRQVGG